MLIASFSVLSVTNGNPDDQSENAGILATSHSPIYINGNAGFTSANGVVSGSGTSNDPYIISDWIIDSSSTNGINIRYTTAYFVIRNCDVTSYTYKGIYLLDADNGLIEDTVVTSSAYGMYIVSSCSNIAISGCTVSSCSNSGLYTSCDGISIEATEFSDNANYGIWALCDSATISGCVISGNDYHGIYFSACDYLTVSDSEITGSSDSGIYASGCTDPTIEGNDIHANVDNGLYLVSCTGITVTENSIYSNGASYSGIFASGCANGEVSRNSITGNGYGISVASSTGLSLFHNNINGNSDNAYDSNDNDNAWDDGTNGGNFWSTDYAGSDSNKDGIGDSAYAVDGDTSDSYPLMYQWGSFENLDQAVIYPTLGAAVAGASETAGDTIAINDGTYAIPIYPEFAIDRPLTLRSSDSDASGVTISGVIWIESSDVNIEHLTFDEGRISLRYDRSGCNIADNIFFGDGGDTAIEICYSCNNYFQNNYIENYGWGIATSNGHGSAPSTGNTISGNTITGCDRAIHLSSGSTDNVIFENDIVGNDIGIAIIAAYNAHCDDNVFYHNDFVGNTAHAYISGTYVVNIWDNGAGEGNHWSGWTTPDTNSDGIVDDPYAVGDDNDDYYPLVNEYT